MGGKNTLITTNFEGTLSNWVVVKWMSRLLRVCTFLIDCIHKDNDTKFIDFYTYLPNKLENMLSEFLSSPAKQDMGS